MSAGLKASSDGLSAVIQVGGVDKAIVGASGIDYLGTLSASVAANALTIGIDLAGLRFRSTTLGSGAINYRTATSALSLVVPSGATLGTVNATQSRLVVLLIDNAGTLELAVVNIAGGNDLSETGVISTTAISAGATSANVIYSTTARTNVAYRVIGYIESTQATAGTWATAPSTIQGAGGNAVTAMSSLGYGQTWQNVAGSRAIATTYYNTTSRPIFVWVLLTGGNNLTARFKVTINGFDAGESSETAAIANSGVASFIVPPGNSYSVSNSNGTYSSIARWSELR